jgi:glutamate synthase domain-containing protein 3
MRIFLLLLPLLGFSQLHHQTLGIAGGSSSSGVIYSVGQSSVIGNNMSGGFLITQGFVQPLSDSYYVEDINTNFNVAVYPNPFVNEFEASFDKEYNNMNVLIQTLSGQTVFKKNYKKNNSIRVDLSGYSGQTYIITINADGKTFTAKLIKND